MSNTKKVKPARRPLGTAKRTPRGEKLAALSDKELLAYFVANTGPGDPAPLDLYRVFRAIYGRRGEGDD